MVEQSGNGPGSGRMTREFMAHSRIACTGPPLLTHSCDYLNGSIMPRRKIQFVQREYYHIGNRGAGRQSIFGDAQDYLRVIQLMRKE
ncbi:hypothetical protein KFU94_60420 [Chloroflexi bacterium TSY]|nr:hypothetical protein [Chloroflexi bacterium TSY]